MLDPAFQFFHPLAIRGFALRSEALPRPLVIPEYFRTEERERLVMLLLTALRATGTQPGNLFRVDWSDRESLRTASHAPDGASLSCENDDWLWLVVSTPVEEAALFEFVDSVDAATLIDLRFPGGSEFVQWLAVLKGALLQAICRSWERHAQYREPSAIDFRRAGAWFESPLDVLDYCNALAAGLFSGYSLLYAERKAIADTLAARGATLSAESVRALLLYALREPPTLRELLATEPQPEFNSFFSEWRAAGLGWVVGDEFTALPALARLAEIEVLTLFVAHWSRTEAANEPLHQLREKLQHALAPPDENSQPLSLFTSDWLRPSIPLNPEGTCGTPASIRAELVSLFSELPATADDAQLQEALQAERDLPRRHLLLAWRATLWLEPAADTEAERRAESAVVRTLHEIWGKLRTQGLITPRSEMVVEMRAASIWARLRCVLADRWSEQARIADAQRLIPQALEQLAAAQVFFHDLNETKNEAEVLHEIANLRERQGEMKKALVSWGESLKLKEHIGDIKGKAATLHQMAGVIARQGEVERALGMWEEALKLKQQVGDVKGKAETLHDIAWVIEQQGDTERALEMWSESLKLTEQIGDVKGRALTLRNMAWVMAQRGNVERALKLCDESLKLFEQIGDMRGKAGALSTMAYVTVQQGEGERALKLWGESLKLFEQLGHVQGKAGALNNMAMVIAHQGELERAMKLWEESLKLFEQLGEVKGIEAAQANMAVAAQQANVRTPSS